MQYDFYIETTQGIKHTIIQSQYEFSGAPFGFVPYRFTGSCQLDQIIIDDFWRCVDLVLQDHNLSSDHFIRAIKAYSSGIIYGEISN